MTQDEQKRLNEEFVTKHKNASKLYSRVLDIYYSNYCQCAYPRFQQIAGIDCSNTGDSYKCFDTELLIHSIKPYFTIGKSELTDENVNEKWICKKCGSHYEYGWQDFSIAVERIKLKLVKLEVESVGKPARLPIPLYIGLFGHSYPPRTEIQPVSFEEFEAYMTEN